MSGSLLQSLFEDEERKPLTVSELNAQVRGEIERRFASVWVEGEIANFMAARSGHWYFTLRDGGSQLKAAVYKNSNYRIRFQPFDGLQVRVRGRLSIYEPRGEYQILIDSLEPVGEGALKVAFEQIKAKLEKEGLFDEALKRPLPAFPRKIAVVTSPNGAAYFDILHVLSRRARSVSVLLIPVRVQGETAGEEIREAIRLANEFNDSGPAEKIDVLIVGRGGGSSEDLWAFNEEHLARAIRGSVIPVISAVGHEVDFTIADFVADMRAPTPSAAAEIVAQREEDILGYLDQRGRDLMQSMSFKLLEAQTELQSLALSPVFTEFPAHVRDLKCTVDDLADKIRSVASDKMTAAQNRLDLLNARLSPATLATRVDTNKSRLALLEQRRSAAGSKRVAAKSSELELMMAKLDALSPLSVLNRGFSITEKESGEILRDASHTAAGDKVRIRLAKGELRAEVTSADETK